MSSSGMRDQCYASCPASTVCIRPPPFVLTIPGPAICCQDQPFKIEQHNPCVGFSGGRALGGSGGGFSGFISLDADNIGEGEAGDSLASEDAMELLRRPWGRPGGGRPSWGRPSWGSNPGWGGNSGWGRPGWGRPGWGRPGWGSPSMSSGRRGVNTELFNEDTLNCSD